MTVTLQFSSLPMIPSLEDDSVSTTPHIFLDSTSSSVASDWTRSSSSPHMFLSYANSDAVKRNCLTLGVLSPDSFRGSGRKKPTSGTPHLFIDYAGDSSGVTSEETKSSAHWDHKDERAHRRFSSWGASLDDFEVECDLFLQTNQGVSYEKASAISTAMKNAAQESTRRVSRSALEDRNALFASFLFHALNRDDDIKRHTVKRKDQVSESTNDQLKQQEDEILFLRSAVRALVHSEGQIPIPRSSNVIDLSRNCQIQETTDSLLEDHAKIPQVVCISRLTPVIDDLTEYSELIPSEGIFNMAGSGENESDSRANSRPQSSQYPIVTPHPMYMLPAHASYYNDATAVPSEVAHATTMGDMRSSTYCSTMRLISRVRSESNLHKQSFTEMANGEIQSNRARGMPFQIYFKSWNLTLRGRYNGMLECGRPHGSGLIRFDNGDYYIGEFRNGAFHGQGSLYLRRDRGLLKFRGRFEGNEFVGWNQAKPNISNELPPLESTCNRQLVAGELEV